VGVAFCHNCIAAKYRSHKKTLDHSSGELLQRL